MMLGMGLGLSTGRSAGVAAAGPDVTAVAIVDLGVGPNGGHIYAANGTYSAGSPAATLTYQWYVDAVAETGATASTYDNDLLYHRVGTLTVKVTATNAAGSDNMTSAGVAIVSFYRYRGPSGKYPTLVLDFEHGLYAADTGHGLASVAAATDLISNVSNIGDSGDGQNGLRINAGTTDIPTVPTSLFFLNTDVAEGNTVYSKSYIATPVASCRVWQIDDGSSANRIAQYRNGGNTSWRSLMTAASVDQVVGTDFMTETGGAEVCMVYAWATNSVAFTGNGGTTATDAAATIPAGLTTLRLGHQFGNNNQPTTGRIKLLTVFPFRMADADTDTLSGNTTYGDPT
jgi:hypothetical protein